MKEYSISAFAIIVFMLGSFSLVSANFYLGNQSYDIKEVYFPGEPLSGWVNLSVENETLSSYFSDNFGNKLTLNTILKKLNVSYTCIPKDCGQNYFVIGQGFDYKKINITKEILLGFKLVGSSVEVTDVSLNIKSNAQSNCVSQLLIDFNADNTPDFSNNNYLLEDCGSLVKSKCYSRFSEWFSITSTPYCEIINLPKSPAFEIKASIKKEQTSTAFTPGIIKASVYNSIGELIGSCNLSEPSTSINYVSCLFPYVAKDNTPYSVCVSSRDDQVIQGYFIQARATSPFCGFYGFPLDSESNSPNGDYNISVISKKFDKINSFNINQSTFGIQNGGESLAERINNYLEKVYNSDCSNSCFVPIKISGINQEIELSDLNVVYTSESSGGVLTKILYTFGKSDALIKSKFFKLPLDILKFKTPQNTGNYTLKLSLGFKEILQKNISTQINSGIKVSSIYPVVVPATQNNEFFAFLDYSINPSLYVYKWDFGDGTGLITTTSTIANHVYSDVGNFTVRVSMYQDNEEISVSLFNINVTSPKDAIPPKILELKNRLSNIKTQIGLMPQKYQESIKTKLDLSEIEEDLKDIEIEFNQKKMIPSTFDSEYADIMTALNEINIPQSIEPSDKISQSLLNYPPEIINLESMDGLFDEDFDDEEYKDKIYSWSVENIDFFMNYNVLSAYNKNVREDLASNYKLSISPINELDYPVYIVIKEPRDNLIFSKEYNITDNYDYTGIILPNLLEPINIEFLVLEKISPDLMPIFITPSTSSLGIDNSIPLIFREPKAFMRVFIGFLLLILAFLAIYIFLQEWYKNSYEKSLFKNKNQLYNLIFFVSNAKKQKKSDTEIIKILKTKGWKGEQIDYAIKKFSGQKIGMWEIPIFKLKDKKKVEQEIAKRNIRKVAY